MKMVKNDVDGISKYKSFYLFAKKYSVQMKRDIIMSWVSRDESDFVYICIITKFNGINQRQKKLKECCI